MITECWKPQSNHRDTFFSIYLVILVYSISYSTTCLYNFSILLVVVPLVSIVVPHVFIILVYSISYSTTCLYNFSILLVVVPLVSIVLVLVPHVFIILVYY